MSEIRLGQRSPVIKHLQAELLLGERPGKVFKIARRLHGNQVSNLILICFHPAEIPVSQASSEYPRVYGPLREDVAQNQVGRACPERFQPAYERAKENAGRIEQNQI